MNEHAPPIPAYERHPYRTELGVRIVRRARDENGRPYVVLDDTILYPAGGGQPADHGRLGDAAIVDVQRVDGELRHFHDGPLDPAATRLQLNWRRRFDHMQQHTAQHLLTAIAEAELGWATTSFHLGEQASDIELDASSADESELELLEDLVVEQIRRDLSVTTWRVSAAELPGLGVRSRGLPEGHTGDIRVVEIGGVDRSACGGTHVSRTGELETLALLATEPMRGGVRLHWIAGSRVRRNLRRQRHLLADIRHLFETSEADLVAAASKKLERLAEAEREVDVLGKRLAHEAARRLRDREQLLIEEHFDDADAAFLRHVAAALRAESTAGVVFLTASCGSGNMFLLSADEDVGLDVGSLGKSIATTIDGRGGGGTDMFQGKAGSLDKRDAALALLREALSERPR